MEKQLKTDYTSFDITSGITIDEFNNKYNKLISQLKDKYGHISNIKIHADRIIRMKDKLNNILSENTGRPLEEIVRDTERDNFMSAQEALDYGLIDKIITAR
jgi:ATP-dependent Clp endopeptidase proteolytic subunit ClpP